MNRRPFIKPWLGNLIAVLAPALIWALLSMAYVAYGERVSIQWTMPAVGNLTTLPPPKIDTGWVAVNPGGFHTVYFTDDGTAFGTLLLSGDPSRYVVDIMARGPDASWGVNGRHIGSEDRRGGFYWRELDGDSLSVHRDPTDHAPNPQAGGEYRVRVWEFAP